jgi:hypothetical protein
MHTFACILLQMQAGNADGADLTGVEFDIDGACTK